MRTKRVNRYYCEHCEKSGCNSGHIKAHEKKCCHNPDRICEMCGNQKRDYARLATEFSFIGHDIDWLRECVEGCPWCMLAVILQCNKKFNDEKCWQWDFKAEKEEWFAEQAEQERLAKHDY